MRAKSHAANQPLFPEILLPEVPDALRLLNQVPRVQRRSVLTLTGLCIHI
jgi:hypothetical protein